MRHRHQADGMPRHYYLVEDGRVPFVLSTTRADITAALLQPGYPPIFVADASTVTGRVVATRRISRHTAHAIHAELRLRLSWPWRFRRLWQRSRR